MYLLKNMSIRHKILAGFGLVLALVSCLSALSYRSFHSVGITLGEVIESRQPIALQIKNVNTNVHKTAEALGYFIVGKEQVTKDTYHKQLTEVSRQLTDLQNNPTVQQDPETLKAIGTLEKELEQLTTIGAEILDTTVSYEKNFPGIAFANGNINPLNRVMIQQIETMLRAEPEIDDMEVQLNMLLTIADLRYSWTNVMRGIRGYLAFRSDASVQDTATYIERAEKLTQQLAEQGDNLALEQADGLAQFQASFQEFKSRYTRLLELHGSDRWRMDSFLVRSKLVPLLDQIGRNLDTLVIKQESAIQEAGGSLLADAEQTASLVLWLTVFGVLFGILVAWWLARLISHPICQVATAMGEVASGDGDLTRRLEHSSNDEIGRLVDNFNMFIERVHSLIKQTARATGGVISSVAATNDSAGRIADRVVTQTTDTDQVAAAVTEMAGSIAEVARHASSAEQAAGAAAKEAENGRKIVHDAAGGIQRLAEQLKGAETAIQRLSADSQAIGSVLDVIKGIAEQTNLLALNAAIEAARAGDLGRGFAVVADEVRSLATRTQESTGEINSMIGSLQTSATEVVDLMSSGRKQAITNAEQATNAIASLHTIAEAMTDISSRNTQIAVATEQQRIVSEDIHKNLESVSAATRDTAREADQTKQATERLGDLAASLQETIGRFKLTADDGFNFESAKNAHLAWRARVRAFLDGKGSLTESEAVSHHDCMLGKWYYGDGGQRFGHLEKMQQIEAPHAELHKVIREIIQLKKDGNPSAAERKYSSLVSLSGNIVGLLDKLQSTVQAQKAAGSN